MVYFFELVKNQIGFSRIGKINFHNSIKKSISTPNIVIPFKQFLSNNAEFIDSFGFHDIFIISEAKYINKEILNKRFVDSVFLYIHNGTLQKFQEIIDEKKHIFYSSNVLPIIPFSIPTTSINKDFSELETKNYLKNAEKILQKHSDIDFGLSIKLYGYSELFNLFVPIIKRNSNIKLLNFSELFNNLTRYRRIIELIANIRKNLDNNLVLMVSGKIISNYLPVLIYLGFDLIDSSYGLQISSENLYDSIETLLPIYKIRSLPCSCLSCDGKLKELSGEKHSAEKIDLLCYHNLMTIKNYMKKAIQYLHTEDFRSFVEKSSLNNLSFISLLKILDKEHCEFTKFYSKLVQSNKIINCLGPSSYYRPDFDYFRKNTIDTFEPEFWTKLIVLLPCSAKKPYSQSKSHQKFLKTLSKNTDFYTIQEIILTSPLGAIPRQLEDLYPANSYDIPVTGEWDEEEIKIASDMLVELLNKYDKNIPIICHIDGGYKNIAERAEKRLDHNFINVDIKGHLTSSESLDNLNTLIQKYISSYIPKQNISKESYLSKIWIRKFQKIIDYQFGKGFGKQLISNDIRYRKNKYHTKMELFNLKSKEKIAIFELSTGKINLMIKGAEKIAFNSNFLKYIIFDGEIIKGNTIFRPGIIDFSPELFPDDNICVFDKKKENIIALGNMIVGSEYIKNSSSGRVIKIYETNK